MSDLVLAIDTSTAATAVGLATSAGEVLASGNHVPGAGERPGHASQVMALAVDALAAAGADWSDVRTIGVGTGPGGFTGLRIGIATGLGLAAATGADTAPVSSLDALALATAHDGPVVAVIDARRSEVFARRFANAGDPDGEPWVGDPELLDVRSALVVGDGAERYREQFVAAGGTLPEPGDPLHEVDGSALVKLATQAAHGPVAPLYLREPDAQPRST